MAGWKQAKLITNVTKLTVYINLNEFQIKEDNLNIPPTVYISCEF